MALGVISFYGIDQPKNVLPIFNLAAASNSWELREHAQMFIKKLIKKYPDMMQDYMLNFAISDNLNVRRFVAESMRPVKENKWFQKNPEYSLKVLRLMFQESKAYPRSSVGNNLSDLARQHPKLILNIVTSLVESGNSHSIWIANRACRNLIKQHPIEVFSALKTDFYKYKSKTYKLSDYPGN